jgi:LUD domain
MQTDRLRATPVVSSGLTMTEEPASSPPAPEESIQAVAAALGHNHIEAVVVDTGAEARERVIGLVPAGSEVHWAKSRTLEELGLTEVFLDATRYDPVRPRYMALDRKTHNREIRKLSSAPDIMLGSVQAVTLDGALVVASYSGSQIGPYAAGAGRLILVVGSQKIVADLGAAIQRIHDIVTPYEDARLREQMGRGTHLAKLLVSYMEPLPGRVTVILVREPVGI